MTPSCPLQRRHSQNLRNALADTKPGALRDLESLGIVHREQLNEIPLHVEYSLTEKGRALLPVFFELARWGETFLDK